MRGLQTLIFNLQKIPQNLQAILKQNHIATFFNLELVFPKSISSKSRLAFS
jgi:hypothetical protein